MYVSHCNVPSLTAIALQNGSFAPLFDASSLKPRILHEATDPTLHVQHFLHQTKALLREGGATPPVWLRANGKSDIIIVGATAVSEIELLLARPNSGLKGGEALKGKVLGLSDVIATVDVHRVRALRAYETALATAGLDLAAVTLKNIQPSYVNWQVSGREGGWPLASERALLEGEVDIIYARGVSAIALREKYGLDTVLDFRESGGPHSTEVVRPITVHRHLLNDNPQLILDYINLLQTTARWARANPEKMTELVSINLGTTPQNLLVAYGDTPWSGMDISLTQDRVESLQSEADFLFRHKFIEAPVAMGEWIKTDHRLICQRLEP